MTIRYVIHNFNWRNCPVAQWLEMAREHIGNLNYDSCDTKNIMLDNMYIEAEYDYFDGASKIDLVINLDELEENYAKALSKWKKQYEQWEQWRLENIGEIKAELERRKKIAIEKKLLRQQEVLEKHLAEAEKARLKLEGLTK